MKERRLKKRDWKISDGTQSAAHVISNYKARDIKHPGMHVIQGIDTFKLDGVAGNTRTEDIGEHMQKTMENIYKKRRCIP